MEHLWSAGLQGIGGFGPVLDSDPIDSLGRDQAWTELKTRLGEWFSSVGSVIADPFLTLIWVLVVSAFVFLGARLLVTPGKGGSPREITFESALRIVAYGLSPSILVAVPLVGGVVAKVWIAVVTVIGAREVYRVGTGRAIVIGLFPKILFWGLLAIVFFFFAALMVTLLGSVLAGLAF